MAGALAEYRLAETTGITPEERRLIAARRVAALTPAERARLADRNAALMSGAEMRVTATDIAVDGPGANLAAKRRGQR
jgi:hypothetical protein